MTSSSRKRREEALRRLLDEMAGTTQGRSFFSIEQVEEHRDRYVFRGDIDSLVDQLLTPAPSSAQKPLWW